MKFKRKRKDWLFAGFIVGLILVLIWLIAFFVDKSAKNPFEKVMPWVLLFFYISNSFILYNEYKKELKKENELQNKKQGVQ